MTYDVELVSHGCVFITVVDSKEAACKGADNFFYVNFVFNLCSRADSKLQSTTRPKGCFCRKRKRESCCLLVDGVTLFHLLADGWNENNDDE